MPLVLLIVGFALFGVAVRQLQSLPHPFVSQEIAVRLPVLAQLIFTGGDRYLSANIASVRTLVTETAKMKREDYSVLAAVQRDASLFNPAHEDIYYTAAAILPWSGELEAAQVILRSASLARPFDYQPSFFYAFNLLHFKRDPKAAAEWLQLAADKLPVEKERQTMRNFAARWIERSDDLALTIRVVQAMAAQSKTPGFRKYLEARVKRLETLQQLREAANRFEARTNRKLRTISELLDSGVLSDLPVDPFGFGFSVDDQGVPVLLTEAKK